MEGSYSGFRVDDGAYESYVRNVDPYGDDLDKSAKGNVGAHIDLAGDGFSVMGGESGFTGAYTDRMKALEDRMGKLGQKWRDMSAAMRRTRENYDAIEDEGSGVLRNINKALG